MKVSAVLLKYHRPKELEEIEEHLETYDFINEILICDNSKESNLMCYGRYLKAKEARNDTIYVQDDDCIVDVKKLYERYDGTKLVNGMKASHFDAYNSMGSMVGWGALFDKSWISVFDAYIKKYGEDKILIREADRIFTSLLPRETVVMDIKDFPSATSEEALYRQPYHLFYKVVALERVKNVSSL